MYTKLFIDKYYSANSTQAKRMENQLEQLLTWAKDNNLNLSDIKVSQLDFMFGSKANISKTKFFETRRLLVNFFTWLNSQGLVGSEIIDELRSLYISELIERADLFSVNFRDENQLDERICAAAGGASDAVLNIRSLALLYWHGVQVSSVPYIKKEDVDLKNTSIFINRENRKIIVSKNAAKVLSNFAVKDEVKGFPGGNRMVYMPSQYLFRSAFSPKTNLRNISNLLHHFNECLSDKDKLFLSPVVLRRNGLFVKVHNSNSDDISAVTMIKNDSDLKIFMLYYNKWKQYFNLS